MVNQLTPEECLATALMQIERHIAQGVCTNCAIALVSSTKQIDRARLAALYLETVNA